MNVLIAPKMYLDILCKSLRVHASLLLTNRHYTITKERRVVTEFRPKPYPTSHIQPLNLSYTNHGVRLAGPLGQRHSTQTGQTTTLC